MTAPTGRGQSNPSRPSVPELATDPSGRDDRIPATAPDDPAMATDPGGRVMVTDPGGPVMVTDLDVPVTVGTIGIRLSEIASNTATIKAET